MSKLKTRKSISKRFKMTKTGKMLRRATGLNHYRAKKSGQAVRMGRKWVKVSKNESIKIKRALKYI